MSSHAGKRDWIPLARLGPRLNKWAPCLRMLAPELMVASASK
jgi:hypothetical protein